MKLIIATPSPYARKARIALFEKGIRHDAVVDVPWNTGTTAPAYNPLGQVPILIPPDHAPVYDSRVILQYLEMHTPEPALLPQDPQARLRHLQLEALADGLNDAIVLHVLEDARKPELRSADWKTRQRAKIDAGLKGLNTIVEAGGGAYVVDDAFGLADIAIGCALGYAALRLPDLRWQQTYRALYLYSTGLEARQSFQATQPVSQGIDPLA
ncbi:MAG: glutathione S-transferase N-terminal domain-containing protein [Pseudomonadota bacterium]